MHEQASALKRYQESLREAYLHLRRNLLSLVGLALVVGLVFLGVFAPYLAPYNPKKPDTSQSLKPPSAEHPFGTDGLGMDIFSRVIWGARIDLIIALAAVFFAVVVGVAVGILSGYLGGWFDLAVTRVLESQESFPTYVLAMLVIVAVGRNMTNLIFVVAFINYPVFARIVRGEVLSEKDQEYVEAARALGSSHLRLIFKHLLPNCLSPIYVQASLTAAWALQLAAGLSFLGLGVQPPTPEWGVMVGTGVRYVVTGEWWVSFFPGMALLLVAWAFNLIGDGLQDVFDPKKH